jgi:hypothetical protein
MPCPAVPGYSPPDQFDGRGRTCSFFIAPLFRGKGEAMEMSLKATALFIAGFGPIVMEAQASRDLYGRAFGIPFKEESGGYLHTEGLNGANSFALWPLSHASKSCFGTDSWPHDIPIPQAWIEFDVDDVEAATADLNRKGIGCWSGTGMSRGARLSVALSGRKDCWSESRLRHGCGKRNDGDRSGSLARGD